jgi:hypothetical protein
LLCVECPRWAVIRASALMRVKSSCAWPRSCRSIVPMAKLIYLPGLSPFRGGGPRARWVQLDCGEVYVGALWLPLCLRLQAEAGDCQLVLYFIVLSK